jgi:hypothetical protein
VTAEEAADEQPEPGDNEQQADPDEQRVGAGSVPVQGAGRTALQRENDQPERQADGDDHDPDQRARPGAEPAQERQ